VTGDDLLAHGGEGCRSNDLGPAEEKVRRKGFHSRSPAKYNERLSLPSYAAPEELVSDWSLNQEFGE
jgi:hypothetical protein